MRARLVFWNVVCIACILGAMGLALRFGLRANLLKQIDGELEASIAGLKIGSGAQLPPHSATDEFIQRSIVSEKMTQLSRLGSEATHKPGSAITEVLRGSGGQVTLESRLPLPRLIPVPVPHRPLPQIAGPLDQSGYELAAKGNRQFHDERREGRILRTLSVPIRSGARVFAVAQASRDLTPFNTQIYNLDVALATLIPVALIVSALCGAMLVGTAMRPLRRMIDSAGDLDADLSAKRLPIEGTDEFAELARTFNQAFDRTAEAFSAQSRAMRQLERFTGDAGHELRTPLGAVKGSISYLLQARSWGDADRKSLEIIDRASNRMERLIADLLLLAKHDAGATVLASEPVSIKCVAEDAVAMIVRPSSVSIECNLRPELTALGDEEALIRVFTNLVSNAFAYSRASVWITGQQEDGWVRVVVEDDGEGIASEHLARLGERFYRPDTARARESGGTGLGLAIAKSLIDSQGGSLQIDSTLGVGTRVTVRLPG